jgi:pimeloyl-ACP methyl ester carboxylesterase
MSPDPPFSVTPIKLVINSLTFDAMLAGPATGELVLFLHGFPEFADSWLPIMAGVADAGFRVAAFDQRGYSPDARPASVDEYGLAKLASDVLAAANQLGTDRFHLVGHDWGGMLAWHVAADRPEFLRSLTVLSTPHPVAFLNALRTDSDQQDRSRYIKIFRMPGHVAEAALLAEGAKRLRAAYEDKLPAGQIDSNVRRLSEPGALTAALNWYRGMDIDPSFDGASKIVTVPTLYVWGEQDHALGEAAALATAQYVTAPYSFVRLPGKSHWLPAEASAEITPLLLDHVWAHAD